MARPAPDAVPYRRVVPWVIVGASLVAYLGVLVAIGTTGVLLDVPLPWWLAQTAPPVLYLLLTLAVVRPAPAASLAGGALLLWAVHLLLGMLTEPILLLLGSPGVSGLTWTFPPAPLPQLIWVPVLLFPLRHLLRSAPARPVAARPAVGRQPVPERRPATFSAPNPAVRGADKPLESAASTPSRLAAEQAPVAAPRPAATNVLSMEGPRRRAAPTLPATAASEITAAPAPEPSGSPAARAAAETHTAGPSHAQRLADDLLARETSEEPLRVSASRILNQLPAEAFAVPADRLADEMLGRRDLVVPRRLALAQLGEGVVRADWDVFVPQIPARLLAMSPEEIRAALPGGQCLLPLDEIVRQFSPELFLPTTPAPDVRGIEVFPAPFQPLGVTAADEPAVEPEVELEVVPAPAMHTPIAEAAAGDDTFSPLKPSDARGSLLDVVEEEEPAPPLSPVFDLADAIEEPRGAEFSTTMIGAPVDDVELIVAAPPEVPDRPRHTASEVPAGAAESDTEPIVSEADAMRAVAALLPPVGSFALDTRVVDGVTLLTASSPDLGHEVGVSATARLLPAIAPGRAPWPIDQVTLRGARAAVVVTPLGPVGSGAPVLVATVPPGGALAWLELRCRQAATVFAAAPGPPAEHASEAAEERDEPDLLDVEPSTRTREVAASLGALGTVSASSLRDAEADRGLFLFLPPGSDVRAVGAFAHEVSRCVRRTGEAGATFRTAVLRSGARRMVIRIPSGHADTIVAAGETARPGLAYRQVEQAAAALGAL